MAILELPRNTTITITDSEDGMFYGFKGCHEPYITFQLLLYTKNVVNH